jgi:ribosomal protein L32
MPPVPKHRASTQRKGKRRAARKRSLQAIVYDKVTGKPRQSHRKAK